MSYFFGIWDIKAELKEMRDMLERIEILQYGRKDAVASVEGVGQTDPVIEGICRNTSLYPESMLMQDFPLLLQWDPRWGYQTYSDSCVGVGRGFHDRYVVYS